MSTRVRLPRGFHEQADGAIVCPHRDLSCCGDCLAAHDGLVDVHGVAYWIPDDDERAEMLAMLAEPLPEPAPAPKPSGPKPDLAAILVGAAVESLTDEFPDLTPNEALSLILNAAHAAWTYPEGTDR